MADIVQKLPPRVFRYRAKPDEKIVICEKCRRILLYTSMSTHITGSPFHTEWIVYCPCGTKIQVGREDS